jgi:serine/threonine protein phosphatase 1
MNKIKAFGPNLQGVDYVVGDIHANFRKLYKQLKDIGFNPGYDRLFSVGDLVDRGPDHDLLLDILAMPWFHAVRGNHEDMIIRSPHEPEQKYLSKINGGDWFFELPESKQADIIGALNLLPLGIEVMSNKYLYGIVHADVGYNVSWDEFRMGPEPNECMWSRDRIRYKDEKPVYGVYRLFVGHTPTKPLMLGNVVYLDNGAWASDSKEFNIQVLA